MSYSKIQQMILSQENTESALSYMATCPRLHKHLTTMYCVMIVQHFLIELSGIV